jgi:hypothetical protein
LRGGVFSTLLESEFEGMNKKELSGKITGTKKVRYSEGN